MTQYQRELQIFRDGALSEKRFLTMPLADGKQGNLQTLAAMSQLVREQRTQPDYRAFVQREIVGGVAGHDFLSELDRCFVYAQTRITYRRDPYGTERVADIWSTLYAPALNGQGDCGIKSGFFAACAALLGHAPFFVVIRQKPGQSDDAPFDHVYAAVNVGGDLKYFDPTPEDRPAGWQAPSVEKKLYPVFA